MSDRFTVRLLGLPLELHRRAADHMAAMNREFALIHAVEAEESSVPRRLLELTAELRERFRPFSGEASARLEAALERGESTIDLVYSVPGDAADASRTLGELLDEADAYCRAGEHLITLATPPDAVAYRRWYLDQFVEQIAERAPVPWPGSTYAAAAGEQFAEPVARIIQTDEAGRSAWVRLEGEIDLEQAPALRDLLARLLATGTTTVVLDGSDVAFIDSVGVSVLMVLLARCRDRGGTALVVDPNPRLRKTLETAGVADLLLGG